MRIAVVLLNWNYGTCSGRDKSLPAVQLGFEPLGMSDQFVHMSEQQVIILSDQRLKLNASTVLYLMVTKSIEALVVTFHELQLTTLEFL